MQTVICSCKSETRNCSETGLFFFSRVTRRMGYTATVGHWRVEYVLTWWFFSRFPDFLKKGFSRVPDFWFLRISSFLFSTEYVDPFSTFLWVAFYSFWCWSYNWQPITLCPFNNTFKNNQSTPRCALVIAAPQTCRLYVTWIFQLPQISPLVGLCEHVNAIAIAPTATARHNGSVKPWR